MLHRIEAGITNCLSCECYIEERQRYKIVYVNVTYRRDAEISNCLCKCYIEEGQGYKIVYVNVTYRRDAEISNCSCICYSSDMKLFMLLLHRRQAGITNCSCEYYIEERQRYKIVHVNVTYRREAEISNCV
jgi:hypothetical protein